MNTYIPENVNIKITKDKIYFPEKINEKIITNTKDNNLSIVDIHNQFYKIDFNGFYNKIGRSSSNDYWVESAKLPEIAYVYYFLFTKKMKIPDISYLCKIYLKKYFNKTNNNKYILKEKYQKINNVTMSFSINDIYGRICRAYNSFNREVELLYNLFKYDEFDVSYNLKTDIFDGIDISIKYNDQLYGVFVYQDSQRANFYRKLKNINRHKFSNFEALLLPARFKNYNITEKSNIVKYGSIYAFSPLISKQIKETIMFNKNEIKTQKYA